MANKISPGQSRIAVTYMFFMLGMLSGNWISRIPDLQSKFNLSSGDLGLLLTGLPIGSVLTMAFIGKLISGYSSKSMTIVGAVGIHIILPIMFLIQEIYIFWFALILFGIVASVLDVSMNSQGIEVEKITVKSIISSLHAFFSIGGFVGALIGGFFITIGWSPEFHLLAVSLLFSPIAIFSFRYLKKEEEKDLTETIKQDKPFIQLFKMKQIWLLGAIAFISILGEAMMNDWSLIYVLNITAVEKNIAPIGFALFSLCMTIGRLFGDKVVKYTTTNRLIQICSGLGAIGLFIAVIATTYPIAFLGYILMGLGFSIVIPFIFRLAGNQEGIEIGSGLAGVYVFGYLAGVVEPVLIGQIANISSLRVSFAFVGILTAFIIFLSREKYTKSKTAVESFSP